MLILGLRCVESWLAGLLRIDKRHSWDHSGHEELLLSSRLVTCRSIWIHHTWYLHLWSSHVRHHWECTEVRSATRRLRNTSCCGSSLSVLGKLLLKCQLLGEQCVVLLVHLLMDSHLLVEESGVHHHLLLSLHRLAICSLFGCASWTEIHGHHHWSDWHTSW